MFLSLFAALSLLITFTMCVGAATYLWGYRHLLLPRIILITQICYALWALWVLLIFASEDIEVRIALTRLRQVTNPFLTPTWVVMALVVFHKDLWHRFKRWAFLLYLIPIAAMITSVAALFGFPGADALSFYDFQEIKSGHGLLVYKVGSVLSLNFFYSQICIVALYSIYLFNGLRAKGLYRKLAFWFSIAGIPHITIEIVGRLIFKDPIGPQISILAIWPVCLVLMHAVTNLEFLDIKSLAQRRIFEQLPSPIIILTPSKEIWDLNTAAKIAFDLKDKKDATLDSKVLPLLLNATEKIILKDNIYQLTKDQIPLRGGKEKAEVYLLSDITPLAELNQELEENNIILRALNVEVMKATDFNRKIHAILSHDLAGSISSLEALLVSAKKISKDHMVPDLNLLLDRSIIASATSKTLLSNILTWNMDDEPSIQQNLGASLASVLKQLATLSENKSVQFQISENIEHVSIFAPRLTFESILRNILSNAIKFSHFGGTVRISALSNELNHILTISDDGIGMDNEKKERFLKEGETSLDSYGYGVGLKFVLRFVKKIEGTMDLESQPEQGTTVVLKIPR